MTDDRVFIGVYRKPDRPNQRMPVFGLTEQAKVDPLRTPYVDMFGNPVDINKLERVE